MFGFLVFRAVDIMSELLSVLVNGYDQHYIYRVYMKSLILDFSCKMRPLSLSLSHLYMCLHH